MNYINFNRTKTSSDALVGDQNTIYFTPDTHEIVMGGEVYGKSISTTPNDGKLTITVNNEEVGTFTANQNSDSNVNIVVPEQITPGSGTLTIKQGEATLGTFSADAQIDVTVEIPAATTSTECSCAAPGNGTLSITVDDLTTTFSANQTTDASVAISIPSAPNNGKLTIKQGDKELGSFTADLSGDTEISIPESSSCSCPTPGNGTLTITQGNNTLGTFTANLTANVTIDIPAATTSTECSCEAPGDGKLTIKVNGLEKGTFSANLSVNSEIDITTGGDDVKLGGENLVKYGGSYILEPYFTNKALDTDVGELINADMLTVKHRDLIPGAHLIADASDEYVILCSFWLHDTLVDGQLYSLSFYLQNTNAAADYKISHNLGQTPTETEEKWIEGVTYNGAVDLRIEFTGYKHEGITKVMFKIEPLLVEPLDIIIHSVKLEKGNTVTDWSLPLYDTQVYPKSGSGPVIATGYSGDICLPTDYLPLSGGTMSGNITMSHSGNYEITWPRCGSIKSVTDGISIVAEDDVDLTLSLGSVATTGNMRAAAFFETSDIRKKDIIAELSLDKCYSLVDKCQTIIYSLKGEDKKQVGMIAQEIEEFFPEVVATDAEGFKSLAYDRLVVLCFKILKDVIHRLSKLENV